MELRRITPAMIEAYMADYERGKWPFLPPKARAQTRAGNSPSTVNKMIACLRNVFDLAVKAHVIARNPAGERPTSRSKRNCSSFPAAVSFTKIIEHIRQRAGKGRIAADLVEGLSHSGLRLQEAGGCNGSIGLRTPSGTCGSGKKYKRRCGAWVLIQASAPNRR